MLDMLKNISGVRTTFAFMAPSAPPTMLVSEMIIAGEEAGAEG